MPLIWAAWLLFGFGTIASLLPNEPTPLPKSDEDICVTLEYADGHVERQRCSVNAVPCGDHCTMKR